VHSSTGISGRTAEDLRCERRAVDLDEVKTGAKLAWGGASDYFGVKPDMICLAKSIGGGLPPARLAQAAR